MRVYILHFDAQSALMRAFDHAVESPHVTSCMVEADCIRLRFLATKGAADALVERIYADGGLVWCSRHDLRPDDPA